MFDAVITDATADYFVKRLNGKKYHFCRVGFPESNRLYTYVTKDLSIKPGDSVTIPTGNGYVPDSKLKQVVEVFDASLDELDFSVVKLRCIEEKLKSIVCPHCGASIEINVGEKVGRCTRCQSEFYLIDYNQNTEATNQVRTVIMPEIPEEPTVPEKSTESKPIMQAETEAEEKEASKEAVQSEAHGETAKSLDQEEKHESEMTEEVTEPETSEEAYESDMPGKPDNDPGTYSWDDFYPFHDNDDVVDMMREEGVKLIQGSGIKPGDLAMALGEVEKEKNRLKILSDLKSDGYHIQEKDIVDYFDMEGDGKVLNEMISMFTGTFSKKAFMEFYTCGTEVKLSTMLKKAATNLDFTESEIIDILNSIDDSDIAGIKELLARYNPRSISKNTVIEICDVLPSSAIELARKYLKLLPFADRVEIQDDYF
ncbi:MAG: hypothetical protein J6X66_04850 [Lachnospiraceae bacterium]|nr:hypothetical protein [Lachnospiraceae bacterium]